MKKKIIIGIISVIVISVLVVGGLYLSKVNKPSNEDLTYLFVEINPSFVLTVENDKVTDISCLNDDCLIIYNDVNVKDKNISDSLEHLYNLASDKGFDISNGITVKTTKQITVNLDYVTVENISKTTEKELLSEIKNKNNEDNEVENSPSNENDNSNNNNNNTSNNNSSNNNSNSNSSKNNSSNNSNNNQQNNSTQPTATGINKKGNAVFYNDQELFGFNTVAPKYWQIEYIVVPRFNSGTINALSKDIRQDILKNYLCSVVPKGCKYNIITDRNEPVVLHDYSDISKVGMISQEKNQNLTNANKILIGKACINYLNTGVWDPPILGGFPQDISNCEFDNGFDVGSWQRYITTYENHIAWGKYDSGIMTKSVTDFNELLRLLSN